MPTRSYPRRGRRFHRKPSERPGPMSIASPGAPENVALNDMVTNAVKAIPGLLTLKSKQSKGKGDPSPFQANRFFMPTGSTK